MSSRKEELNVTELRGLACVLLVAYHVVGVPGAGMQVDDNSWYRYVTDSIMFIRMPLFTFVSGLVYAYRPVTRAELKSFYQKKLRRLLIPFILVSALFFAMQSAVPGANRYAAPTNWWEIYIYPYAHFWYLQALLLIFALVGLFDAAGLIRQVWSFSAIFGAATGLCLADAVHTDFLGMENAIGLLPYFLLGVGFTRFRAFFDRPNVRVVAVAGLVTTMLIHQSSLMGLIPHAFGRNDLVAVICGMSGGLVLTRMMPSGTLFRAIGDKSYAIYLYHAFFTAAARIVLSRLGADDLAVFAIALAAGVGGPMVIDAFASIRPWARTAFVGRA